MFKNWVVPALAVICAFIMPIAAVVTFALLFVSLGLPPCTEPGTASFVSSMAVPVSLLIGSVIMYRLRHQPSIGLFFLALAIPAACFAAHRQFSEWDRIKQASCKAWSLDEVKRQCGVNEALVVERPTESGNRTVTLVAPGTTDSSWQCLWRWSNYHGSVSLIIDPSVYEHARNAADRGDR